MEKSTTGIKLTWFIIGAVVVAIIAWIIVASTSPAQVAGQAVPGQGVAKVTDIALANACNVKIHGAGVQLAKANSKAATVDDAALDCVKSSGGSFLGGPCSDGEDDCSSTFSLNEDPDSDPTVWAGSVSDGTVTADLLVTAGGQVFGGPIKVVSCVKENALKKCQSPSGACHTQTSCSFVQEALTKCGVGPAFRVERVCGGGFVAACVACLDTF